MTIREATITKLQQLPESLLQQVSDFIDLLTDRQSQSTVIGNSKSEPAKTWAHWFQAVDRLEINPTESDSNYQQLLLSKYRQQGLELRFFAMQESCSVSSIVPNLNTNPTEIQ